MKPSFFSGRRSLTAAAALLLLTAGSVLLLLLGYLESRFGGRDRIFLPPAAQHLYPEKREFRVAVFGDFAMQSDAFLAVLREIRQLDCAFIVSAGDMFRRQSGAEGEYLLEMLSEACGETPLYAIPGNHDLPRPGAEKSYERYFGQRFYSFGCGDTLFVMLDDGTKRFGEAQLRWLERTLRKERGDFRRCVVFMHVPPVVPAREPFFVELKGEGELQRLEAILSRSRIDAIVCGHLHLAERLEFAGIPVFITPCSGQRPRDAKKPHFGFLELRFPANGGVDAEYRLDPGIRRGRWHLMGWLVTTLPGRPGYFYSALAMILTGGGLLIVSRRQVKKSSVPQEGK